MVSIVVVGPLMSGKTSLCRRLVGLGNDRAILRETRSCSYATMKINNTVCHVWDTPALNSAEEIDQSWPGEDTLAEANIVIVCHDGRHNGPMAIVRACGPSRCIIALTRSVHARTDVAYCLEYLSTVCDDGSLVPRAHSRDMLLLRMWQKMRVLSH